MEASARAPEMRGDSAPRHPRDRGASEEPGLVTEAVSDVRPYEHNFDVRNLEDTAAGLAAYATSRPRSPEGRKTMIFENLSWYSDVISKLIF